VGGASGVDVDVPHVDVLVGGGGGEVW